MLLLRGNTCVDVAPRVMVNRVEWKDFDAVKEIVRLKPATGSIAVRAEYGSQ